MPQLTNRFDLPKAFLRYEEKNSYSKGDADFSITELIDSPQIARLKKTHDAQIEEDVSGRIMSILGTAIHEILQHSADEDDIAEERFYTDVAGCRISGQVDLLSPIVSSGDWFLRDYKTVRGQAVARNPNGSEQWIKQINGYAFLARENGYVVEKAEVIAIVRDWTAALVRADERFPKQAVVRIPIPLWHRDTQRQFIERCVRDHSAESVRECTNEERWKNNTRYAVMEYAAGGGFKKRARRVFDTETEAMAFIMDKNLKAEIVAREAQPTRCIGNYCLVAPYCEQYKIEDSF